MYGLGLIILKKIVTGNFKLRIYQNIEVNIVNYTSVQLNTGFMHDGTLSDFILKKILSILSNFVVLSIV